MRLLMTTDTVGGVWTYSMELCTALADSHIVIELASMGRELSMEQRREVARFSHVRLHESRYRLCWMREPWEDLAKAGEWLLRLEHQLRPDLIHLNDLGHGGLPWSAPVLLVGHSCVFSWHAAVKGQEAEGEHWRRYRALVSKSVAAADMLVAPTRAMLNELLQFYGPALCTGVIHNGRNFPELANTDAFAMGWQSHCFAANSFAGVGFSPTPTSNAQALILTAGRLWDEAKNIASLVDIAKDLRWPLYVAGEQLEPGTERSGVVADGVHYLGFLSQTALAEWLSRASIYAAPAHYEPFGLGILEAARSACALVLGDIESLREVWGDAALYVPPDDPERIAWQLNQLALRPQRGRELARRAWQRAKHYSSEQMAAAYRECYQRLLEGGTNRPRVQRAGAVR